MSGNDVFNDMRDGDPQAAFTYATEALNAFNRYDNVSLRLVIK